MPRPGAYGSYHDDPPAEIRQAVPLFDWAREQAAAVKATKDRIDEKRNDLAVVTETVEDTMEWKDVEDLKEKLKEAKKAAIAEDGDVIQAEEALADARKQLQKVASFKKQREIKAGIKALEAVAVETKDRLASGLAAGKVPNAIDDAVGEAIDGMARAAGEGGCVTFTGGGQSVTIKGKGKRGAAGS